MSERRGFEQSAGSNTNCPLPYADLRLCDLELGGFFDNGNRSGSSNSRSSSSSVARGGAAASAKSAAAATKGAATAKGLPPNGTASAKAASATASRPSATAISSSRAAAATTAAATAADDWLTVLQPALRRLQRLELNGSSGVGPEQLMALLQLTAVPEAVAGAAAGGDFTAAGVAVAVGAGSGEARDPCGCRLRLQHLGLSRCRDLAPAALPPPMLRTAAPPIPRAAAAAPPLAPLPTECVPHRVPPGCGARLPQAEAAPVAAQTPSASDSSGEEGDAKEEAEVEVEAAVAERAEVAAEVAQGQQLAGLHGLRSLAVGWGFNTAAVLRLCGCGRPAVPASTHPSSSAFSASSSLPSSTATPSTTSTTAAASPPAPAPCPPPPPHRSLVLSRLELGVGAAVDDVGLRALAAACPHLQALRLEMAGVSGAGLGELLAACCKVGGQGMEGRKGGRLEEMRGWGWGGREEGRKGANGAFGQRRKGCSTCGGHVACVSGPQRNRAC